MTNTSYIISLQDEFVWSEYKEQVDTIMKSNIPLVVTWDLSQLTHVPWQHVWNQVTLMIHYRPIMIEHIKNNIIILPNEGWKKALEFLFQIVPPVAPTILQYK